LVDVALLSVIRAGIETRDEVYGMANLNVIYESTPNPNSMKFVVGRQIADETVYFDEPLAAARSPLALKLFNFAWVQAVMVGPDFITISKQSWVEWSQLADPLSDLISEHLERNEGVLLAKPKESAPAKPVAEDTPIVMQIKDILDREIRPAVARDGGDIIFDRYENNRVYLHLVGACSGCPSSTITLKQGVETRMKAAIPEIIEVISV
jgi:Fe-S cluster biogenesis protein NfuA